METVGVFFIGIICGSIIGVVIMALVIAGRDDR